MKKTLWLVFVFVGVLFASSCSTPESKAKALVKEHMKTVLYHPESYEFVSIKLDSAYAPFASPSFHEKVMRLGDLSDKMVECQNEIESERQELSSAESMLSIYSIGSDVHSRNQYRIYKAECDIHHRKLDGELQRFNTLQEQVRRLYGELKKEATQAPSFIGYTITHRYRVKNNAGQTILSDVFIVTDCDFKDILLSYDEDSDEFAFLTEVIKQVKNDVNGKK